MSHMALGGLVRRLKNTRSTKSFAKNFLLPLMAGQKIFLYNEDLPEFVADMKRERPLVNTIASTNGVLLTEIWKSMNFLEFRQRHLRMDLEGLPVCGKCICWNDYSDIWESAPEGGYAPPRLRLADFFRPAPGSHGG